MYLWLRLKRFIIIKFLLVDRDAAIGTDPDSPPGVLDNGGSIGFQAAQSFSSGIYSFGFAIPAYYPIVGPDPEPVFFILPDKINRSV